MDVLLLCETWHDRDSIAIRRLRADGFSVVEHARPRRAPDSLGINHGGVVIAAVPGVRLSVVDVGFQPSNFEIVSGTVSCIVVVIPPGIRRRDSRFLHRIRRPAGSSVDVCRTTYTSLRTSGWNQ